jgi:hypothetical protein
VEVQAVLVSFLTVDAVQAVWPRIQNKYKLENKNACSFVLSIEELSIA